MTSFFDSSDYRSFLRARYDYLKATRSGFSARALAMRAKLGSPSYFRMVVEGKRRLSRDTAARVATGLHLNEFDRKCLILAVEIERASDETQRLELTRRLDSMRKRQKDPARMNPSHVEVLSDLTSLKAYVLSQSRKFQFSLDWLMKHFGRATNTAIQNSIDTLALSGLWRRVGNGIEPVPPSLHSGDSLAGPHLANAHLRLLDEAKDAITRRSPEERVISSQTFLFNPSQLQRIQKRIIEFKRELEAEFEDLNSTAVFHLNINFFELDPTLDRAGMISKKEQRGSKS